MSTNVCWRHASTSRAPRATTTTTAATSANVSRVRFLLKIFQNDHLQTSRASTVNSARTSASACSARTAACATTCPASRRPSRLSNHSPFPHVEGLTNCAMQVHVPHGLHRRRLLGDCEPVRVRDVVAVRQRRQLRAAAVGPIQLSLSARLAGSDVRGEYRFVLILCETGKMEHFLNS